MRKAAGEDIPYIMDISKDVLIQCLQHEVNNIKRQGLGYSPLPCLLMFYAPIFFSAAPAYP